ncbi:MAG: hypothetical protein OZSIB_0760 [Candidatus Ozemobacter sibiricus]|uniref:Uncharacterized protein n=1 Tax=Candidatus Ozemobacter sibiricus TaxID=2268124 RepID=A0A367ZUA3_9BACT|nr:MAG: hypothetical protein OZSIB_0760 [Candidatus Ozemobacter sibiricus]
MTGTEFMVNIRRDHTHIQVSRGTVLLFPARGSPLSLSAPHAARLTAQEAAVIRADIEAPPASGAYAPALDQDVEGGSP